MTVRPSHRQPLRAVSFGGRALALALVALFVQGQLASLLHSITARHVVCSEHGELIDVPDPATAGPQARPSHDAVSNSSLPAQGDLGHHHCEYLAATRPRVLTPSVRAVAVSAPLAVAADRVPPRRSPLVLQQPVLLAAPKTSPPVRA